MIAKGAASIEVLFLFMQILKGKIRNEKINETM